MDGDKNLDSGQEIENHHFLEILDRHALSLYSLTETAFDFEEVRERCCHLGWKLSEEDLEFGVARFQLEDGREAVFDSGKMGGLNGRAFLWLPHWPDYADESTDNGGESARGRQYFDSLFEAAFDTLQRHLGQPMGRGQYEYRHRSQWPYFYALWRGERGFLVLQQDELDIQFGFDVSIWILAEKKGEALPSFPLTAEADGGSPVTTDPAEPLWDRELDG